MIINWREELIKLFPETTDRIIPDNTRVCNKCNGLGLLKENTYMVGCNKCYGKGYLETICPKCGKEKESYRPQCNECLRREIEEKDNKKRQEAFDKAKKISINEYDGYLLSLTTEGRVVKSEDFYDDIYDMDLEDVPTWVFTTKPYKCFNSIDLIEIINDHCESGYEDMENYLDSNSPLLQQAQELIDKWELEQGDLLNCYEEDYNLVVMLDYDFSL